MHPIPMALLLMPVASTYFMTMLREVDLDQGAGPASPSDCSPTASKHLIQILMLLLPPYFPL